MLQDFLFFMALAAVTNTVLPFPFEPVLLHFAAGRAAPWHAVLALAGSASAGLAGAVELRVLRRLATRLPRGLTTGRRFFPGRSFYGWTFLMAFLPLPFSVVRVAALRERPHPVGFGLATALGRLPRHALIVGLGKRCAFSPWLTHVLLGIALLQIIWLLKKRRSFASFTLK